MGKAIGICIKECFSAGIVWEYGAKRTFKSDKELLKHSNFEPEETSMKARNEKLLKMSFPELEDEARARGIELPNTIEDSKSALEFILDAEGLDLNGKSSETKSFSQWSVDEYKAWAEKFQVEIPEDVKTFKEIRAFLAPIYKEKNQK